MIIGLITRRGVVFWNRLAELYRTIAVSASLDHLLPIVSVKNGVRKLAVGVQIDIENEIFQKKIQEKNRKEVKNEKITHHSYHQFHRLRQRKLLDWMTGVRRTPRRAA